MADLALPPSDVADSNDNRRALGQFARTQQLIPTTIPFAVIGGTPRADGFQSVDSTTYVDITRSDCAVTAQYLWYDFQMTAVYGVAPTSIDWKIYATFPYNGDFPASTTLATGSGASGDQVQDVADLFALITRVALSEFMSVRLAVKRTGGSGEAAGVRMIKPWLLRSVSA